MWIWLAPALPNERLLFSSIVVLQYFEIKKEIKQNF